MSFDYKEYFDSIKPRTQLAIYNRFLFAFLSVHTTWESNIRAYKLLKGEYWIDERFDELRGNLIKSGVGMYNNRADYIMHFTIDYLSRPKWFLKKRDEKWTEYRDRLMKNIRGLGHAKSSFAIEMVYPNACWVTCVDTHIAQVFGVRQETLSKSGYDVLERLYIERAKKENVMPTEYRWSYWDKVQNKEDCRYWSHVLETEEK